MFYLYVTDASLLPFEIYKDYGRNGALIATSPKQGPITYEGRAWKELQPFEDSYWDEATQTLLDAGSRYYVGWGEMWDRFKTEEQYAIFDLEKTDINVERWMHELRIQMSRVDQKQINLLAADAQAVLAQFVVLGVLTPARVTEITEGT